MTTTVDTHTPARPFTLWRIPRAAVIVTALALVLPYVTGETFLLYIATLVALYAIGAMSLHLVLRLGQFSLGHAAFMGIGGYTSVLLATSLGVNWWLAAAAGTLLAAATGLLVGPLVLRLKGVFFVLFTFTFGEFARQIFVDAIAITGGSEGISAIPAPAGFTTPTSFYYLVLAAALATAVVCGQLLRSQFGDAIDAICESETLARSNGMPVFAMKVITFTISCGLVGMQGALEASFVHYVSPISYSFPESLRFVVINVIGGLGSLWGPIIGSAFLVALPELLRSWVDYQWVLYGVVLILLMKYLPGGLLDVPTLVGKIRRRGGR
ncbi:branched-chain amino acid ABC transporter permease [Reyranella sp. CPCC 100927]|uniref:branched-chain amino acid ABC transporter permease n=1 Tax=Reyranella sp. CPCC 100927 TaxID=2599616 RepID=UPI0011B76BEF|nr:branched-chain amino acid ABC transporter permease [Reyranella sp. CPCC 100927]TWT15736.1 branched-chain amino acid ABC transporter permease [Reyranella sp. CPCC 100927]